MVLAGLTTPEWEISIVDENLKRAGLSTQKESITGCPRLSEAANIIQKCPKTLQLRYLEKLRQISSEII